MRVVMLSASFPPEIGGIQAHLGNLAPALAAQGHQVKIVTLRREKGQRIRDAYEGVEVIRVPQLKLPKLQTAQYLALATAVLITQRLRGQADVVHYHTYWPDAFTAFLVNKFVPVVYTAHESRFLIMAEQARFQKRLQLALRPFQTVIAPSTELMMVAQKFGVDPVRSIFIPNAVDSEKFSPAVARGRVRARYGIPADHDLILCPRRLVPKNGVEFLIESLPLIRQSCDRISVVVAGDGPERQKLEQRVRELSLQNSVIFAGSVANADLPAFYADADVVVIPSLMEATSIAGLEAMASACAVVATDAGGLPEIIDDGRTGLLVPPRDPNDLAAAIIRVLENPQLRTQLGKAARARVESEFTWAHVAGETARAYEQAIALWHGRAITGLAHA